MIEIKMSTDDYITKTTAKELYFFTEIELTQIDYTSLDRGTYVMKLYHKDDIYDYLKIKYKTESLHIIEQRIHEIKQLKDEQKQKRLYQKEIKKEKRKIQLIEILKKHGLTLRSDSKLCKGYLDGSIKETKSNLNWIVERMCQMKFLFEYCNMKHEIEKAKEEQSEEWDRGYIPDNSVFEEAEMNILKKINGYPKVFPWLK